MDAEEERPKILGGLTKGDLAARRPSPPAESHLSGTSVAGVKDTARVAVVVDT